MNSFVYRIALIFAAALPGLPVGAQDPSNLRAIATLSGVCERAVAGGTNMSEHCKGSLVQSIYKNGRTGFTVAIGDKGTVLTFSGMEGAKPDADSQLQSVDVIILNLGIEGVPPSSAKVNGSCAYSNPYKGPMTVSCQAVLTTDLLTCCSFERMEIRQVSPTLQTTETKWMAQTEGSR